MGQLKVLVDTDGIGTLNPFRYRSYYFDVETNLYYLQTRYYDPELGRFISADSIEYLDPETLGGLNLYAYCGNNPVMNIDKLGSDWNSFWKGVGDWFVNAGNWINNNIIKPTISFMQKYGDIVLGSIVVVALTVASILTFGITTVALGMAVGALVGAANAFINGDNILYGALSGAFVGILSGIGGPGPGGMLFAGFASGIGAATASLIGDVINKRPKDYKKAAISGVVTGIFAGLGNGASNALDKFSENFLQRLWGNYFVGLFASTLIWIPDIFSSFGAKNK